MVAVGRFFGGLFLWLLVRLVAVFAGAPATVYTFDHGGRGVHIVGFDYFSGGVGGEVFGFEEEVVGEGGGRVA